MLYYINAVRINCDVIKSRINCMLLFLTLTCSQTTTAASCYSDEECKELSVQVHTNEQITQVQLIKKDADVHKPENIVGALRLADVF